MKVSLQINGAGDLSRELGALGERLAKPAAPLLQAAAAMMQTAFQTHIRDEEGPDGPWPAHHPATKHIRRWYGHADGPRLVRNGDLLQSIQTLAQTADAVEVGTRTAFAGVVQDGGTVTDDHGRRRTVQAFPFVYLTEQEIADLIDTVSAYYFEGDGVAA
jgi:phage gpG-like protein